MTVEYPKDCGSGDSIKLDSGQKIGVGTSSPSEEIHVYGSGDMKIKVQSTNNHASVWISNDNGSFNLQVEDATGRFRIYDVTGGGGEVVSILKGGNVGIGTTSPSEKLEVNGGDMKICDNGKGIILTNAAGTYTKRVYLNSTGNGLSFTNP